MKLIKPSTEILNQEDLFKHIELCGRVCYKSEDKITENSSQKFVETLIKSGHTSVLEHGTIYLTVRPQYNGIVDRYINNKYSKVNIIYISKVSEVCYITTNYRVLIENNWFDDLKYQCEPTEFHEKRVSVRFICDRGISHELARHRVFSFSQESTRYCNYSKDKFENQITFIIPNWLNIEEKYLNIDPSISPNTDQQIWLYSMNMIEEWYNDLIVSQWSPQQARSVLPNSLKTEVIMTGFISDWKHFFKLRTEEAAHPQMRELAIPLQEEFIKLKLI